MILHPHSHRPAEGDQTADHLAALRSARRGIIRRSAIVAMTAAAALAAAAASAPVAAAALPAGCAKNPDGTVTCSYAYTGSEQQFKVPSGVTSLSVTAVGASGAQSQSNGAPAAGGSGALVSSVIPSTPGQAMFVEVGGNASGTTGGYNGGANGGSDGGGGGGASDIRTCSVTATTCSGADNTLDSRLLVAGGGGGGGTAGDGLGGAGGASGPSDNPGGDGSGGADPTAAPGHGGGSGTLTAGGSGGVSYGTPSPQPGGAGSGGAGGNDPNNNFGAPMGGGGGGGGGYYGGGGGGGASLDVHYNGHGYTYIIGPAGGGGPGSSYITPAGGDQSLGTAQSGQAPSVSISYTPVTPTITSISPATLGLGASGVAVTVKGQNFDPPVKMKITGPSSYVTGAVKSSTATAVNLAVNVGALGVGQYTLTIIGADGQTATCNGCLNVVNGPRLDSLTPFQVSPGETTSFTATGANFSADAKLVGPTGVSFSHLTVSSDGTTITGTMTVAKTAPAGGLLLVTVKDGPLGNYGTDKIRALTIT